MKKEKRKRLEVKRGERQKGGNKRNGQAGY